MSEEKETRDHETILKEHQAALESYGELASNPNTKIGDLHDAAEKIKALGNELSGAISAGAEPCKQCEAAPLGMLKTPSYINNGVTVPAVYEVGCVHCDPVLVPNEVSGATVTIDGETKRVVRRSFSARANDPAEAVRKWNAGEFVEDTLIDRMRGLDQQK